MENVPDPIRTTQMGEGKAKPIQTATPPYPFESESPWRHSCPWLHSWCRPSNPESPSPLFLRVDLASERDCPVEMSHHAGVRDSSGRGNNSSQGRPHSCPIVFQGLRETQSLQGVFFLNGLILPSPPPPPAAATVGAGRGPSPRGCDAEPVRGFTSGFNCMDAGTICANDTLQLYGPFPTCLALPDVHSSPAFSLPSSLPPLPRELHVRSLHVAQSMPLSRHILRSAVHIAG